MQWFSQESFLKGEGSASMEKKTFRRPKGRQFNKSRSILLTVLKHNVAYNQAVFLLL